MAATSPAEVAAAVLPLPGAALLALSADDALLAACSGASVRVYSTRELMAGSATALAEVSLPQAAVQVAWRPGAAAELAALLADGSIQLLSLASGAAPAALAAAAGLPAACLAWSPDGARLAVGAGDEVGIYAAAPGGVVGGWQQAAAVRVLSTEVQDDDQELQVRPSSPLPGTRRSLLQLSAPEAAPRPPAAAAGGVWPLGCCAVRCSRVCAPCSSLLLLISPWQALILTCPLPPPLVCSPAAAAGGQRCLGGRGGAAGQQQAGDGGRRGAVRAAVHADVAGRGAHGGQPGAVGCAAAASGRTAGVCLAAAGVCCFAAKQPYTASSGTELQPAAEQLHPPPVVLQSFSPTTFRGMTSPAGPGCRRPPCRRCVSACVWQLRWLQQLPSQTWLPRLAAHLLVCPPHLLTSPAHLPAFLPALPACRPRSGRLRSTPTARPTMTM